MFDFCSYRGLPWSYVGLRDGLGLHDVVISWLNPTPHAITVYASDPALLTAPATLVTGRLAMPYPDGTFTR
jgi:hypothetical protein